MVKHRLLFGEWFHLRVQPRTMWRNEQKEQHRQHGRSCKKVKETVRGGRWFLTSETYVVSLGFKKILSVYMSTPFSSETLSTQEVWESICVCLSLLSGSPENTVSILIWWIFLFSLWLSTHCKFCPLTVSNLCKSAHQHWEAFSIGMGLVIRSPSIG